MILQERALPETPGLSSEMPIGRTAHRLQCSVASHGSVAGTLPSNLGDFSSYLRGPCPAAPPVCPVASSLRPSVLGLGNAHLLIPAQECFLHHTGRSDRDAFVCVLFNDHLWSPNNRQDHSCRVWGGTRGEPIKWGKKDDFFWACWRKRVTRCHLRAGRNSKADQGTETLPRGQKGSFSLIKDGTFGGECLPPPNANKPGYRVPEG